MLCFGKIMTRVASSQKFKLLIAEWNCLCQTCKAGLSVTNEQGFLVILIKKECNNFDILSEETGPSVILRIFWLAIMSQVALPKIPIWDCKMNLFLSDM